MSGRPRRDCYAQTYVWRLAGRRVTLQTLYFLRMVPQCVTSTFRPAKAVQMRLMQSEQVGYTQQPCAPSSPPTFDLFGKLDPVGVGEGARLLVNVVDVQDFTHELDHRLGLIKRCG